VSTAAEASRTEPGETSGPALRLVHRLRSRFAALIKETSKFGVVGACSYVLHVSVFNVFLVLLHLPAFAALAVTTVISTTFAFLGNRFWTWRDRERSGLHREYALYFGFNLVGLVIGEVCLWVSHDLMGAVWPHVFQGKLADNVATNIVGVVFASAFRFWSYRRYVFPPAAGVTEPTAAPNAAQAD
jgi:putative flippase GtrA